MRPVFVTQYLQRYEIVGSVRLFELICNCYVTRILQYSSYLLTNYAKKMNQNLVLLTEYTKTHLVLTITSDINKLIKIMGTAYNKKKRNGKQTQDED